MVHIPRDDIQSQTDVSRIISVYKIPLQSAMSELGLGLKANIFGLRLEAQVLGLGLGFATRGLGLGLANQGPWP